MQMNKYELVKQSLPVVSKSYATFDIIGQTFGKYFDYLKEKRVYEYETTKLKEQSKIIIQQIQTDFKLAIKQIDFEFEKLHKNNKLVKQQLKDFNKELNKYHDNLDEAYKNVFDVEIAFEERKFYFEVAQKLSQELRGVRAYYNSNQFLLKGE